MVFHPLRVVDQRRVSLQLLGDLRMSVQEPVEVGEFLTRNIRVRVTWAVFVVLEALLPLHEKARGFLNLFAHSRMAGQEGAQIRMVFHPLRVVDQRGVGLQLLGDFRMGIQEPVKVGEFLTRNIRVRSLLRDLLGNHGQATQAEA